MRRTASDIHNEWLVIRCQAGEDAALGELVQRWHQRLYRHALRLVDGAEAADEVTQEAWLAIVRGLRRLDDPAKFGPWALSIVTNKCRDWVRQRVRHRARGFRDGPSEEAVDRLEDQSSQAAINGSEPNDDVHALRIALRQLSTIHRVALTLHYLDGMNVAEISTVLGIAQGTVKSRLHHARERLRAMIERNERVQS